MDEDQVQNQEQDVQGVMESVGMPQDGAQEAQEPEAESPKDELPAYAKKRLGMQEKRHKKELRVLQEQLSQMQSQMSRNNPSPEQSDPYASPNAGANEDQIQRAVRLALQAKDDQDRRFKEQEKVAHVHKKYQALQDHLDNASDQYDDFDDVVRSPDAPYTEAMRDAALLLPNAADVLYNLGKNKDRLREISKLHPLDQAEEMVKLSVSLMNGNGKASSAPRTIGQIKSNPVTSNNAVTDKTSVSELRRRMKAGWK